MESMFIFVSFRSVSQAVRDDDRGAKSSCKNANGKKHMFRLEHNLYQVLRRPFTNRDHPASGPCAGRNSAIFSLDMRHNPHVRVHQLNTPGLIKKANQDSIQKCARPESESVAATFQEVRGSAQAGGVFTSATSWLRNYD